MMNRTIYILLAALLSLAFAGTALAIENPLLVQLPIKINNTIKNIIETQRSAERQSRQKEARIKSLVNDIQMTSDDSEIYRLQKEYIALRAEALAIVTHKIDSIENDFASIADDLNKLDKIQKDSARSGIGQGIRRDDPIARQAITDSFKGFGTLLDMVETLNPQANLDNTRTTVFTLDEVARQFFRGEGDASLREQEAFIKEAMVAARSVQRLIGVERDYLMRNLYVIDAKHMIRQFGQLKEAVFDGFDVASLFNERHEEDAAVLGAGSDTAPMTRSGGHYNTKRLGENYEM